jgi:hypothetical protein
MTSPLSTYGGGSYASSAFPDTPIYDRLVAERGTPQIAPIRVTPSYDMGSSLPALPALPSASTSYMPHTSQHGAFTGYTPAPQPAAYHTQPVPTPYIPQQASGPRGYTGSHPQQAPQVPHQGNPTGYDAVRPVPPRPVPPRPAAPGPHGNDQYRRPDNGQGY